MERIRWYILTARGICATIHNEHMLNIRQGISKCPKKMSISPNLNIECRRHQLRKRQIIQDLIEEFMAQKRFAIVGATADTKKYGNEIFHNLTNRGYEVYPVNPRLKELEGTKCYPTLSDIPVKVDVVDFVVPPPVTMEILKECKKLGLERIWLQPGSENEDALNFCNENNLRVVHSVCVMMN